MGLGPGEWSVRFPGKEGRLGWSLHGFGGVNSKTRKRELEEKSQMTKWR